MTFAKIHNRETTTVEIGGIKTFVVTIFERINEYCAERKELEPLPLSQRKNRLPGAGTA